MEKILLRDSPKKISYYASCLQIPKVRICLVIKNFIVTNRVKLADGCFLAFPQNHNDFFCHGCQMHLEKPLLLTYSSDKLVTQLKKKLISPNLYAHNFETLRKQNEYCSNVTRNVKSRTICATKPKQYKYLVVFPLQ